MKRTISVFICGVLILSSLVFSTGCSGVQSTYDLDLSKYVSFGSYSPVATLNEAPDYEKCIAERDDIAAKRKKVSDKDSKEYENYTDDIARLTYIKNALGEIKFSLSKGKDGEIKNGDTITVKAKYNKDKIANYHVDIKSDEFTVKVSGLEEKEVIDPFDKSHFEVKTSGIDGDGYIKNALDDENDDIDYSFSESDDLSNGDTVTVTASIDSYYDDPDFILKGADEYGEVTKEITVSGLGTVPETLDGVDTSDVDSYFSTELENYDCHLEKGDTGEGYELKINSGDYEYCQLKVTNVTDYKKVKGIYGYNSDAEYDYYNTYGVVFSRDVTVKVTDPSYTDIKKNSTKTFTIYYLCYYNDFMVNEDNKLEFIRDSSDIEPNVYVEETYKDAKEEMTEYYSDYKFTELD